MSGVTLMVTFSDVTRIIFDLQQRPSDLTQETISKIFLCSLVLSYGLSHDLLLNDYTDDRAVLPAAASQVLYIPIEPYVCLKVNYFTPGDFFIYSICQLIDSRYMKAFDIYNRNY